MKYPSKLVVGILLLVILAATGSVYIYSARNSATAPPAQEAVDTQLGQYVEDSGTATTPANIATSAPAPLVPGCSLQFSFTPAAKIVAPGGTINYALLLRNGGQDTCNNVSFSVYYSGDEAFVSSSPKATSGNYYWSVGNLGPGKTYSVTDSTEESPANGATQISNEACATADNSPDVCGDNLIFVQTGAPAQGAAATSLPGAVAAAVATGATVASEAPGYETGVWEWNTIAQMAPEYAQQILTVAQQNGFNTMYLTTDDYVDIAALPDGAYKQAKEQLYMQALNNFVVMAKAKGIAIDIEGGDKDWALPANQWKGFALIDLLNQYNQTYPNAKIQGLQYDVESYLLPEYTTDPATVLTQYVSFIDQSVTRMESVDGQFSIVLPHFYDSQIQWTPPITYNGKTAYTYTQLLTVLQKKPGSAVIIMAYRNSFTGANGTDALAQAEVQEASSGKYSTKVIVAQETGNVTPSYVTFYGLSKASLLAALGQINTAFSPYPSYAGVAVDYLDPFLALKN